MSDTHNGHHNIKGHHVPCDLVIHAGDITFVGKYDKLIMFNDWGGTILGTPQEQKVCIAGNHECTLDGDRETADAIFSNWTYLQDQAHEVLGLKIWGSPWSPEFGQGWGFQLRTPEQAKACWAMIPDDTDIVVVHGPPFGYGDRTVDGRHVGCPLLLERLNQVRPRLVVTGHVHGARGVYGTPWGVVVNACVMTEGYKPKNRPIVINLPIDD